MFKVLVFASLFMAHTHSRTRPPSIYLHWRYATWRTKTTPYHCPLVCIASFFWYKHATDCLNPVTQSNTTTTRIHWTHLTTTPASLSYWSVHSYTLVTQSSQAFKSSRHQTVCTHILILSHTLGHPTTPTLKLIYIKNYKNNIKDMFGTVMQMQEFLSGYS